MQKHSSFESECMKNLANTQCNCIIHECIKKITSLNSTQFRHLNNLLNLFQSPYKICDEHNYPFEFYSEQQQDIQCKFCLHSSNEIQLIEIMTHQEIGGKMQQFPNFQIQKNIEKKIKEIQELKPSDFRINTQEDNQDDQIKIKIKERQKLKETIEFLKLTVPTEVHNEFHEAMEKIKLPNEVGEDSCKYDVLKLRNFLLQNK
ncbi:unnamed protein product [Paramecium sonneborni]|uniref:Uncharacterized protein n=1 Tax=Paramecium sonneborni TaxID=65129 RepID=A0A8S1K9Z4_9CILI|nr:unnamed protein product [Paramecium sonneborni]